MYECHLFLICNQVFSSELAVAAKIWVLGTDVIHFHVPFDLFVVEQS